MTPAGSHAQETLNPRIEITPTVAQYHQLCRDLKALRRLGATSNTAAILQAVHAAAAGKIPSSEDKKRPGER